MKILFLTTVLPAQKLHGSEVASQNVIDALQHVGCEVSVLGYGRKEDNIAHQADHEILVADRAVETKQARFQAAGWFALSLVKRLPYSAAKYISRQYIQRVQSLIKTQAYDAIVIDHAQMGWLLDVIDHPTILLMAHNLEHDIYRQHAERSQNRLAKWIYRREAKLVEALEARVASAAAQTWVLTQHDANYFQRFSESRVFSLPSSFSTIQAQPVEKQFDIGIIGSWSWKPNEEGLRWFLENVYPHLPKSLTVHVAGRGADWIAKSYPKVIYRDFVESSQDFMMQARVMAIPTLSGGGIQIKTLDSIASGSRIVATTTALRGIEDFPKTVSMTDQPQQFAQFLASAVASDLSAESFATVQQWYYDRQTQFLGEVKQAMCDLEPSAQGSLLPELTQNVA